MITLFLQQVVQASDYDVLGVSCWYIFSDYVALKSEITMDIVKSRSRDDSCKIIVWRHSTDGYIL